MESTPDIDAIASSLQVSIGLLRRRLHQMPQVPEADEITMPEIAALALLNRGGSFTVTELARLEQIKPQSMGATLNKLEARNLIERRYDPTDGRQVLVSISKAGQKILKGRHLSRHKQLTEAIGDSFSARELKQLKVATDLLERLASRLSADGSG